MTFDFLVRLLELLGLIGGFLIAIGRVLSRINVIEVEDELTNEALRKEIQDLKVQLEGVVHRYDNNNSEIIRKLDEIGKDIVQIKIFNAANNKH